MYTVRYLLVNKLMSDAFDTDHKMQNTSQKEVFNYKRYHAYIKRQPKSSWVCPILNKVKLTSRWKIYDLSSVPINGHTENLKNKIWLKHIWMFFVSFLNASTWSPVYDELFQ